MGFITTAVDGMTAAIAESDAFQSWVGAIDTADAHNYIFKYATSIDLVPASSRKWATVSHGPDLRMQRVSTGGGIAAFSFTAGTVISFQEHLPAGEEYSAASLATFLANLEAILTDLLDNSGTAAANRRIDNFELVQDPEVQAHYGDIPTYRYPPGAQPGYLAVFLESTHV